MLEKEENSKMLNNKFDLQSSPNIHYQKFFLKFSEIETLDVNKWTAVHVLAYFCKRYNDYYNIKYTFRFDRSPSRSYELFTINRLAAMIDTDPVVLKKYIDWIFNKHISGTKRRITSIGYLTGQNFINEFKFANIKSQEITRSTPLPPAMLEIMERNGIKGCQNYNALAMWWRSTHDEPLNIKTVSIINELTRAGLSIDTLTKIR